MSALAGLWRLDGRPVQNDIDRMLDAQAAYGPDAKDLWTENAVGLGRRLMRTLPEDQFDRQPLFGAGGRLVLVADLRLGNRPELTAALGAPSHEAAERSDADLLLAAYERWGEDCLGRLVGEYAFAVWDAARQELVLARAPVNGRPLHYASGPQYFAFSTMPRGLHALDEVPREPDEETLGWALDLVSRDETRTAFRDIRQVANGSVVVVSRQGIRARNFWAPPRRLRLKRPEDYQDALRETLDAAVSSALRGVTDVAAQLSGGLDSSSVAATAAGLLAPRGGKVVAFTAVPGSQQDHAAPAGRNADEGDLAAGVASLYANMEHVRIPLSRRSPLAGLDQALDWYDQPVLNLCNQVWLEQINEAASGRDLRVMLTGAMGNLTLSHSGYDALPDLLRQGRLGRFAGESRALVASGRLGWRGVAALTAAAFLPRRQGGYPGLSLLRAERRAELGARPRPAPALPFDGPRGVVDRAVTLRTNHAALYRKGILAQWRVDQRDPTADLRLVELCLAIPPEQFLRGGQRSFLLRQAMIDRLPAELLNDRRKGLQAFDWYLGLDGDLERLRREVGRIAGSAIGARTIDVSKLSRMVDDWPSADWSNAAVHVQYRHTMLRTISIGSFLAMDRNGGA